jgi:leader peptidase (prepilin peptidase)/N-methyltransferase
MEFPTWMICLFLFLIGCCVGSFLNVVIWRLPLCGQKTTFRGVEGRLTLNWPPSHCPVCHAGVRWNRNIPVLSWLVLRGRCAACQTPISIRYPLVELGTGLIFAALYLAYFVAGWYGHIFHSIAYGGPTLALDMFYAAALLAAAGIDADWFEIPWLIPVLIVAAALAGVPFGRQPMLASLAPASTPGRLAAGGAAGLLVSIVLLYWRLLPQSFPPETLPAESPDMPDPPEFQPPVAFSRNWPFLLAGGIILLLTAGAWIVLSPPTASLVTLIAGIVLFLIGVLPRTIQSDDNLAEQVLDEAEAPCARREILKELLFLLPPISLALLALTIPTPLPPTPWCGRILGIIFGGLCGGGVIWLIRIGGTLLFGRVAMGMGDVHLMVAIGAVAGGLPAIVVVFLAAFLALLWAVVLKIMGRPNVLPFGPWLSIAGILILLIGQPILHWYGSLLFPR